MPKSYVNISNRRVKVQIKEEKSETRYKIQRIQPIFTNFVYLRQNVALSR